MKSPRSRRDYRRKEREIFLKNIKICHVSGEGGASQSSLRIRRLDTKCTAVFLRSHSYVGHIVHAHSSFPSDVAVQLLCTCYTITREKKQQGDVELIPYCFLFSSYSFSLCTFLTGFGAGGRGGGAETENVKGLRSRDCQQAPLPPQPTSISNPLH